MLNRLWTQTLRESTYFNMASVSLQNGAEDASRRSACAEADDATMADTVEQVAERLAQLEVTVAQGFQNMELRFSAISRKIDVNVEALRSDIQTVAETVTALTGEMRRANDAMRNEHAADREVLRQSLLNQAGRLRSLESISDPPR